MVSGRKPIPLHLAKVQGVKSQSKYDRRPNWIERQKRRLRMPEGLTPNEKRHWKLYVKESQAGHLQPQDAPLLKRLVYHLNLADQYDEKVRHTPSLIKTPNGMPQQSPYVGMINKQTLIIKNLLSELGFTPSSRARLGIESGEPGDDDYF